MLAQSLRSATRRNIPTLVSSVARRSSPRVASAVTFSQQSRTMAGITRIKTDKAAPPAGPYSQAILNGQTLYVSGQIPANSKGELVNGTIAEQTEQCCTNVAAILEEAGSHLDRVLKVNVFLDDMANFAEMNSVYEKWFTGRPARSCVAVKTLPKGVPVEIECIAYVPTA
ncbi:YjgF-like protein [Xylona heveae TC161]|uniref:YjgF-like protein n=1 Tax=Xylona heveae (strain CBS 132557 / TC161) TaxID=1328760 RepID=A0A165I707_XYLHT|nr:YjgF-like protein [Xylona heveae TC161]KZF24482.1 YjgF-like protein [Xylona heveae TC161]